MMMQPAARSSSSQAPQLPEHSGHAPRSSVITPQCFFWPPGSVFEPQQARYDRQDEHLVCSNLVAFQDYQQGDLKADCCSRTTMHSAPTLLFLHSHHNMGIPGCHQTQTPPLPPQVHQRKEALVSKPVPCVHHTQEAQPA